MPDETALKTLAGGVGGGLLATLFAAAVVYAYFRGKLIDLRKQRAEAQKAEDVAAETPIGQWREIVADLRGEQARQRGQLETLQAQHHDCEDRSVQQRREIDGLKTQNAGQQSLIDGLRDKLTRLDALLRANGLADPGPDSGAHRPPG